MPGFERGHDFLHLLRFFPGNNEQGVVCLDHDKIGDADQRNHSFCLVCVRTQVEHQVSLRVDKDRGLWRGVSRGVLRGKLPRGLEASYIAPAKIAGYDSEIGQMIHHAVVNAAGG